MSVLQGAVCCADTKNQWITNWIKKQCVNCHNEDEPNGELILSNIDLNFSTEETVQRWIRIHDRVRSGEMPPPEAAQPSSQEREQFTELVSDRISTYESGRNEVVLRRLNQAEYENSIRDLFGVNVRLKEHLPKDNSIAGFDNVGEGLAVSAEAIQSYLQAANVAIDAILGTPQPPTKIRHVTNLLDQKTHDGKPQLDN